MRAIIPVLVLGVLAGCATPCPSKVTLDDSLLRPCEETYPLPGGEGDQVVAWVRDILAARHECAARQRALANWAKKAAE